MRRLLTLVVAVIALLGASGGHAQKKITPVDNDPTRPAQPTLHYYDKHGNPLEEPVLFLADLDTVTKVKSGPVYPLLQSVSVGANFFDAVMKLAGQTYQSYDVWASLSLFNWIEPVVEFGVGFADNKPDEGNFHYKGKPSFYGKIGFNYNFLYKSNPDYQLYLGFRAGFSSFRYEITDITISSSYWDQTNHFSITDQKAHAFYGEVLAGIKVKIWRNLSLGWNLRYKLKFSVSDGSNSTPWFIPGYGAKAKLSGAFSVIYTLPFKHKEKKEVAGIQDIPSSQTEMTAPSATGRTPLE